jgi:glycosyltransferase involved in cell wall biosynthesis
MIPAYNEEACLGRTLEAIHAAARTLEKPFETVVADDASTDGTAALARQHGAQVVEVNHRQIAATRNAGARATRGEMLIFVDADTIVTAAAVRAAVAAMHGGASGGGCAFRFDRPVPLYGRVMEGLASPLYRLLGLASGCFLFCTRDAFEAFGGFDETMFGAEEAAMSRALPRHGRFVVVHEAVTTSGRKLRAHSAREVLGSPRSGAYGRWHSATTASGATRFGASGTFTFTNRAISAYEPSVGRPRQAQTPGE